MYKLATLLSIVCSYVSISNGDVETILNNPDAINIQAVGVSSDLIWTDEKDMVGKFLPDKVKKNGKATGFMKSHEIKSIISSFRYTVLPGLPFFTLGAA